MISIQRFWCNDKKSDLGEPRISLQVQRILIAPILIAGMQPIAICIEVQ